MKKKIQMIVGVVAGLCFIDLPAADCPVDTVVSSPSKGDLFIEASYIYWCAGEEGLDLGRSGAFVVADDPFYNSKTKLLSQPFHYQSGFKVGVGWNREDWALAGKYTWVRNSTSQSSNAPVPDNTEFETGVWLIAPWFLQEADDGGSLSGINISSQWNLAIDLADLTLSYPCYKSNYLTLTPFGGVRGAWIRQKMAVTLNETPGIVLPAPLQPIHSLTRSSSWAVGPRLGASLRGLLGAGFRLQGDLAFSLLFTEYTKISHKEDAAEVGTIPGNLSIKLHNKSAARPIVESAVGFGWERYFSCDRYHIDISASYELNYFWNQNMGRGLLDTLWSNTSTNGDLYLYGLTLSGRFGF